jgi:hypothetical protein
MAMAIASMHDANYAWLSPYTWDLNGLAYAQEWGYMTTLVDPGHNMPPGFAKINHMLQFGLDNPHVEWIFWKDCDSLLTNFSIQLEDIADPKYHVLLTSFWNGINAGMMMVRNSPQGQGWLKMIMDNMPQYQFSHWLEQQVMIDKMEEYKDIVKLVPQRTFNAACFSDGCHGDAPPNPVDLLGTDGQWQQGDFAMHWPGQANQLRASLVNKYFPLIIPASARTAIA